MAKETVERIIKAEADGAKVIGIAKAKAEKEIINAKGKAELVMNDAKRSLKTYEEEKANSAKEYAVATQEKAIAEGNAQADELTAVSQKNCEAAIKAVMEILV
jgi:vacuolar-type H+-ATPase subunit H